MQPKVAAAALPAQLPARCMRPVQLPARCMRQACQLLSLRMTPAHTPRDQVCQLYKCIRVQLVQASARPGPGLHWPALVLGCRIPPQMVAQLLVMPNKSHMLCLS